MFDQYKRHFASVESHTKCFAEAFTVTTNQDFGFCKTKTFSSESTSNHVSIR